MSEDEKGLALIHTGRARSAELAARSTGAQLKALVEARFIMAMDRPRDMRLVRTKLLEECDRPAFAEEAWYNKPIGEGAQGLSIRFAEAAIQMLGNISQTTTMLYEDERAQIVRVAVVDLETNTTYETDVTVERTVEMLYLQKGQKEISSRINSRGKTTYLVVANEDQMTTKRAAMVSKAIRTNGLRLLPAALKAECEDRILKTNNPEGGKKEDPQAVKNRLVDRFNGLGVMPRELEDYLGHKLEMISQKELKELGELSIQLRSGDARWADVIEEVHAKRTADETAAVRKPPPVAIVSPNEDKPTATIVVESASSIVEKRKDGEPDETESGGAAPTPPAAGEISPATFWKIAKAEGLQKPEAEELLFEVSGTKDPKEAGAAKLAKTVDQMRQIAKDRKE